MMLSEVSLGLRMAAFGLILGGGWWLLSRGRRPPTSRPIARGTDRVARASAVPLVIVGIAGVILWLLGH
jgi:hypothetical protein